MADRSNFDLSPQAWKTLRRLLRDALDLPPPERAAWIAALPADHADFKHRLRVLLQHANTPGSTQMFRTLPKVETETFAGPPDSDGAGASQGQRIGPYRLLRPLGEGGMGSVWLAERTDMLRGRPVALKLPHATWRRPDVGERVAREREILATLEHPHIARLYDAGLGADGQPYLALEFVEGEPIDRFCARRALDIDARLRLFLQVLDAVAHAHARLIVHRDLKPTNILVAADGQAKLLDFGIAKLIADGAAGASALTQVGGRALTPDYASPEQIAGLPIGTASDIYSLGVVLYELLSGCRPYVLKRDSRASLEDAILQAEPAAPSSMADARLRRRLRGDLDAIVLKALSKQPEQRYATINAFADDIQRHLLHQPLLARPVNNWGQLRKYVRRHRLGVGAATAIALALLAGAGAALWQAGEARVQRDAAFLAKAQADQEAAAARAAERDAAAEADLSSFLLSDLAASNADEAMAERLERALVMVRAQYRDEPRLRGRLLHGIAQQYRWISEHARAGAIFAEAEPLLRAQGDAGAWSHLLCIQAAGHARNGDMAEAQRLLARAASINPKATTAQVWAHAECRLEEALIARYANDPARAIPLIEEALAAARRIGRGEREEYSEGLNALARAELEVGRFADAVASARRSIALLERIGRARTPGLRNAWGIIAQALRDGGRPLDAVRAHGGDASFDPARDRLPLPVRAEYAVTLVRLHRYDEALPLLAELIRLSVAQDNPREHGRLLLEQARAWVALGRLGEARASLVRAEKIFAAARARQQPAARRLAIGLADWAIAAGKWDQAQAAIDEARAVLERTPQAPAELWRPLHRLRARLALARADAAAARAAADLALGLSQTHAIDPAQSLLVAEDLLLRAQARRALGDLAGARADAAAAEGHARASAGDDHPVTRLARSIARA